MWTFTVLLAVAQAQEAEPPASVDPSTELDALRARLAALEARLAQLEASPGALPDDEPALSPEDLAAIEAALGADSAAPESIDSPPGVPAPATSRRSIQSLNPDISFITDVAVAAFSTTDPLQTGAHDPQRTGFNLQQLELAIGSAVDPYFRYDANIVFSQFGVEIEEAYGTTLGLPGRLQVRAGQFLTRFGRINNTHPHAWDFVDQPFPVGRMFGGEGNRGLGLEVSMLLPLPWFVEIVAAENAIGGEATSKSWSAFAPLSVRSPLDLQSTVAAKQFFPLSANTSLLWGLSWAGGPNGTGRSNRSEVYGTDLFLKWRPITSGSGRRQVSLHSEWFYRRRQVPDEVMWDLSGFTQVVWQMTRRLGASARWEIGTPALAQDGSVASDPHDPMWTDNRQRLSASLTVRPTEFSRLRFQGSRDHAKWRNTADWAAVVAVEFNVGAHGAHAF